MQSPSPSPAELLEVATLAAHKAGVEISAQRAAHQVAVSFKGSCDLVTSADLAAEKIIVEAIKSRYADHNFLAEESYHRDPNTDYSRGIYWVIDPVDGTTNYAHGHPHVGISIACAIDGEVVAGVVLSPFQNEIFTATKGNGAFLNGEKISISSPDSVSQALVATGFPYYRTTVNTVCARLARCLARCRDIRRIGAASLDICWVACGRLDAFFEESLNPWDGAAGCLIAKEAGARIGHYSYDNDLQRKTEGMPADLCMDNIVVCGPKIFDELLGILDTVA